MKTLKINQTKELDGASANKTVTRITNGFLFRCYETEQKENLVKTSFVPLSGYETLKKLINCLMVKRN